MPSQLTTTKDMNEDLQSIFVQVSTLLKKSSPDDGSPASIQPLQGSAPENGESSPTSTQMPDRAASVTQEYTPPSSQPRSSMFVPTPPCSQPKETRSEGSRILSRQSTMSSLGDTLSSSSPYMNSTQVDGDDMLHRIMTVVQEIGDASVCRICWVKRNVSRPHLTYRCETRICSGQEWNAFRTHLPFPRGILCYFCFIPFEPPFNHNKSSVRQTPEMCEYPDVLKELTYILYQDRSVRESVFARLGVSSPSTLLMYKRYITQVQDGGILGLYEVLNAYLDVRELELA